MYEKLKLIANERIENIGKCKSCIYNVVWLENGEWNWDCGHSLFEKLQSVEETEKFGSEEICPLWEPHSMDMCKVHKEPFLINQECYKCKSLEIEELNVC
jgi:hypothetical protein